MTNAEAIARLKNRDAFLEQRIREAHGSKSVYWYERDRDSIAIAIAAIEFVIQWEAYEAAHPTQETK